MAGQDDAAPHLGELEQAIMEVLWKRQPATVREVVSALPRTPPLASRLERPRSPPTAGGPCRGPTSCARWTGPCGRLCSNGTGSSRRLEGSEESDHHPGSLEDLDEREE